jgi:hypothetical protein
MDIYGDSRLGEMGVTTRREVTVEHEKSRLLKSKKSKKHWSYCFLNFVVGRKIL